MIKHLFKLIWNKKRQNGLLITEVLVSFLVIFAVSSSVVYFYRNYLKPMGIDHADVWVVEYDNHAKFGSADSMAIFYEDLRNSIKALPEVKGLSFTSSNSPFSSTTNGTGVMYEGKKFTRIDVYDVEDEYRPVLNVKVVEGRWFSPADASNRNRHIVINESLKEAMFGREPATGKLIGNFDDKEKMEVIGVVQDMKAKGTYSRTNTGLYQRIDTGSFWGLKEMLIKVSPDAGAAFETKLYHTIASRMKQGNISIEHLDSRLATSDKFTIVPMIIAFIISGFLIFNVALGLFGVLWYNINKRKGEIGLRRAIGASGRSVSGQLVAESLIIATLAMVIGVFFAAQFPLLRVFDMPPVVYVVAIFLSVVFIYLLVLICSLYPGRQAAAIYPAVALHED